MRNKCGEALSGGKHSDNLKSLSSQRALRVLGWKLRFHAETQYQTWAVGGSRDSVSGLSCGKLLKTAVPTVSYYKSLIPNSISYFIKML